MVITLEAAMKAAVEATVELAVREEWVTVEAGRAGA
jgi:hypothetical protein